MSSTDIINGVHYFQDETVTLDGTTDTASIYAVYVDGRPVLEIVVPHTTVPAGDILGDEAGDAADRPVNRIWVRDTAMFKTAIPTKGITAVTTYDGKTHIDGAVVRRYVMPRLARLIARVYVP